MCWFSNLLKSYYLTKYKNKLLTQSYQNLFILLKSFYIM